MNALSPRELEALREVLQREHALLIEAARAELGYGERAPFAAVMEEVSDEGDRASAATAADLDNEIARRHGAALRDIDAALERIARRCYGRCTDCRADIGYPRLAAFPTATRCVDCQRQRERSHAHEATPSL